MLNLNPPIPSIEPKKVIEVVEPIATWAFFPNHEEIRNLGLVIAAFLGLCMLVWRAISQDRSSRASKINSKAAWKNAKAALKNAETSSKSHLAETYARAIDQLGATNEDRSPIIQTRLGALYALEKIVSASEDYYIPVSQTISAYVKSCSQRNNDKAADPDIQACLKIIGTINIARTVGPDILNMGGVDYGKFQTLGLDLSYINLRASKLKNSFFGDTILKNTFLSHADLSESVFIDCDFSSTNLQKTNLKGADLKKVSNLSCPQIKEAIIDKETKFPDHIKITWNDDGTYECEMIEVEENK
jgi:hypothetical protein